MTTDALGRPMSKLPDELAKIRDECSGNAPMPYSLRYRECFDAGALAMRDHMQANPDEILEGYLKQSIELSRMQVEMDKLVEALEDVDVRTPSDGSTSLPISVRIARRALATHRAWKGKQNG